MGTRLLNALQTLLADIRYSARLLRQDPGFATVAVLSLALGIGANTAIFSPIDAVLLKWLPVQNPKELVVLGRNPAKPATSFNYPGAPIKHLRIRIEKGQLVQRGTLHKGVDIPFEMWSTPVLERDGRLRLHPDKLRIFSVNGMTLMRALGLHLEKLMDLSRAKGVSVKGDDLYIEPLQLIPPPTVDGRLAAVRIEDTLLVQEFARTADDSVFGTVVRPDSSAHNFIYFRGGTLRFGRLTMSDTDLLIGDDDETDALDLDLAQYNRQLAAGRTRNLPNLGLRTWLVDYQRLGGPVTAAVR